MTPGQRLALRQERTVPALADLNAWLLAMQRTIATGSGTGKAIDHALKRWKALERYTASGTDRQQPRRNAIRPIAIDKKNWFLLAPSVRAERCRDPEPLCYSQA